MAGVINGSVGPKASFEANAAADQSHDVTQRSGTITGTRGDISGLITQDTGVTPHGDVSSWGDLGAGTVGWMGRNAEEGTEQDISNLLQQSYLRPGAKTLPLIESVLAGGMAGRTVVQMPGGGKPMSLEQYMRYHPKAGEAQFEKLNFANVPQWLYDKHEGDAQAAVEEWAGMTSEAKRMSAQRGDRGFRWQTADSFTGQPAGSYAAGGDAGKLFDVNINWKNTPEARQYRAATPSPTAGTGQSNHTSPDQTYNPNGRGGY
jgi:hypothetical protein